MDTRAFKRSLHHSERYNRRGFGLGEEVAGNLQTAYQSDLVASLRENGYELKEGRLTVRLAEAFGFCWGVERAVAMAYPPPLPMAACPIFHRGRNTPSASNKTKAPMTANSTGSIAADKPLML